MSKIKTGNYYKRISDGKLFVIIYMSTNDIDLVEYRDVAPDMSLMLIRAQLDTFLKEFAEPTELEKALL